MTRKHYRAIAEIMNHRREISTYSVDGVVGNQARLLEISCVCSDLADFFAMNNANFDREKFLRACGTEG